METIYTNESANKGGTYKITNKSNGKAYYGSAKSFKERHYSHNRELIHNKHGNTHLQSAWNLDGSNAFVFEVLEVIDGSKQDRLDAEQKLLDIHWDGCINCYNIEKTALSSRESKGPKNPEETSRKLSLAGTGRHHTEETKKKLSEINRGKQLSTETRQKIGLAFKGKPSWNKGIPMSEETKHKLSQTKQGTRHTEETKAKMSQSRTGKVFSEETCKKISEALRGRTLSEETKRKISNAKKQHRTP